MITSKLILSKNQELFMALIWPKVFMALPWPKQIMTLK